MLGKVMIGASIFVFAAVVGGLLMVGQLNTEALIPVACLGTFCLGGVGVGVILS
jgi:hypothetical protein